MHLGIVLGVILIAIASIAVTTYNLVIRPNAGNSKVVVADGAFASGQEQNVIDDFESQGFHDVTNEDGLGIIAYGTEEMANQYKETFGRKYLDQATETLSGTHDDIGIVSFNHSEQWDLISISTYTNEADVDLFQFMLTEDQDVSNALDEWIAWGVITNGGPINVSFMDGTGSRYFEIDNISSVADILKETKSRNPAGVDWDAVTEDLANAGKESAQEGSPEEGESK